jgi:tetratricopeptide (TPR) repeat protein
VRRDAERATRRFEQTRLRLLPNVSAPSGGPGDIIIGRYRYLASQADEVRSLPTEPPEIAEARRSLLATLDSASRVAPGDAWVRSRLVWYAIEAGDTTAAIAASHECRDAEVAWWCDALLGLALHAAHRFAEAENAFERALVAMPDSTRCRWTDLTPLLDGDAEDLLDGVPCERRDRVSARVWWLADPLHSIEGNELRSEHFARHAFAVLHDRWRASHPMDWGRDMREMTVRYAWPVAWSRDRSRERSATSPGSWMALYGHEPVPAYDFFPEAAAIASPYDADSSHWRLQRERATSHYAHPFAAPMRPLRHQFARLRRGDSLLIVAAWTAPNDTFFAGGIARAALVLSRDDGRVRDVIRSDAPGARGLLTHLAPVEDQVASLELFAARSRAAARARAGLRALHFTNGVAMSDILLLAPGPAPRSFDEVLHRVLPDGRLPDDRQVTLYWELYGIDLEKAPRVSIAVSRVRASFGRRLAERLGLKEEPQAIEMQWATDAPAATRAAGSVTLDLRDRPSGIWRVSVTVTEPSGKAATATRDLMIESR